jgi:hypothetical protein
MLLIAHLNSRIAEPAVGLGVIRVIVRGLSILRVGIAGG